jgi:homocysteine S-methyltransferase
VVELVPPRGHLSEDAIEQARSVRVKGVDAVLIPDGQAGPRLSALSLAVLIQQRTGIETVLQCSARDRSLLGLQSDLLGAHAMGIRNVVLVTGDVPLVGDYSDATAVVDVDSIGLLNAVSRFNHGTDIGGQAIGQPTAFHIGVTVNPGAEDLDREMRRFEYKLEAGADFIVTRPVFDPRSFERMAMRLEDAKLPVLLGLRPFESVLDAEWMANEMPGSHVPDSALNRMRRAQNPEAAAAEGVAIARDLFAALKPRVQGVLITALPGRIDRALEVLA